MIRHIRKCFSPEVPKKDELQPAQVDNVEPSPAPKSLDATTSKTIFEPGTLMPYLQVIEAHGLSMLSLKVTRKCYIA